MIVVLAKLAYGLALTATAILITLTAIILSPAWPIITDRFGHNPLIAALVVLATLTTIAIFGANTLLLGILTRQVLRDTNKASTSCEDRLNLALTTTMTTLMATGTTLTTLALTTLLTSPTTPLTPWAHP